MLLVAYNQVFSIRKVFWSWSVFGAECIGDVKTGIGVGRDNVSGILEQLGFTKVYLLAIEKTIHRPLGASSFFLSHRDTPRLDLHLSYHVLIRCVTSSSTSLSLLLIFQLPSTSNYYFGLLFTMKF